MPDTDVAVEWQVSATESFAALVASGVELARQADAHSVHAIARGLRSDAEYFYRFRALGEMSTVARTRTTPAPGTLGPPLAMAFVSCANWESGYDTAYKRLAEEQPDLILHLGDYIYENAPVPGVVRRHEGEVAITRRVLPDLGPQNPQRALTVTAFQIQRGAGEDRSTPHQLDPDPVHTTAMSEPQSASAPGISSALRQLQTDQTRHATDCRLWGRCRERGTAGHGRYQHRPTTTPVDVGTRLSNVALDTRSRTE